MERKVGEVFDFNGVKLEVKDKGNCCLCNGCYFYSLLVHALERIIKNKQANAFGFDERIISM